MLPNNVELRKIMGRHEQRIAALEQKPVVQVEVFVNVPKTYNALETISNWWYGGEGQHARSRHMRVSY